MNLDTPSNPTPAHLGWRLLALCYDLLPAAALWFVGSSLVLALRGGSPVRANTTAAALELLFLWLVTGAYAVASWRRGGQTLGMRPWRLRVIDRAGRPASVRALLLRYAAAALSLLILGLGFFWSLFDNQRQTWHDRISATRLVRDPR